MPNLAVMSKHSTMVSASILHKGKASSHFVAKSIITKTYLSPFLVLFRGIISMAIWVNCSFTIGKGCKGSSWASLLAYGTGRTHFVYIPHYSQLVHPCFSGLLGMITSKMSSCGKVVCSALLVFIAPRGWKCNGR